MAFICSNPSDKTLDISEDASENATVEILKDDNSSNEDDLNNFDESGITTKIYKSDDPSVDLFDNNESMLDSTLESDILNKDELISMSKVINRKIKRFIFKKEPDALGSRTISILPWLISIVLILLLTFIFKFLIQKTNT